MQQTNQTSNGSKIKEAIKSTTEIPLNEVLYETDRDLNPKYVPRLDQETIKAVAAYKRRQDEIAYGGTILDQVYNFMGRHLWPDNFYSYTGVAIETLTALTDENLSKLLEEKIGSSGKKDLVEILNRLIYFMRDLQMSCLRPLLLIQDIISYDYSEDQLLKIKEEYEERLRISLDGKHRHA